ncbi:cupin domain-containing protein [Vibrio ulleungensis]|uniref:Cupin domain-containing protein n=1 Tax=Vibrio ulleungensis TaxID=2807619 RepID=A0ABS2HKC8_9VIBR|nr:cupin domain-containing protein [Vibrio ulleungensis]MBM7037509.1 cupin domain-containing protein [Vibrio ulleungensis]
MLHNLNELARKQPIDTDYLISQSDAHTHLLLRLGDGHSYPDELHQSANEFILVLEGHCHLQLGDDVYTAKQGEMLTVDASIPHRFLPHSDCLLSIHFINLEESN